jgi:hypothetical protein
MNKSFIFVLLRPEDGVNRSFETSVNIYQSTMSNTEEGLSFQHSRYATLQPRKRFCGCASLSRGRIIYKNS